MTALLVLGSYAHQLYAHGVPRHESSAEHQHSSSDENEGCHHSTCHCSPVAVDGSDRGVWCQVPTFAGYLTIRGENAPEAEPVGIDHPPQLA
ncbi:MAG: hypothetical protein M3463_03365 [Verrucomicrobiota bacterium]|nr:hypothetical protein [Verrucomicrobiota bacterium]